MLIYKTEEEIEIIRRNNLLVSMTLAEVAKLIKPGVTTLQLDKIAEEFIRDHGAVPGFLGYGGYPNTLCTSVNDEVVHGIPSERILKEGDIISVDCGTYMEGFYGDTAYTFMVGNVKPEIVNLLETTKESLFKGIENAIEGKRTGDIGYAVQFHAEQAGYSVVREMVGHGLGKDMHEAPEVPNYGKRGRGVKLAEGLVLCIEPMINLGSKFIKQDSDGWTIRTLDGKPSAHYELAVVIRKDKAEILSTFKYIEEVLNG
ncbi:MAG: type I methionyl aminopeptidase [Bacteroidetes bacterium GWF2_33_16]|nr:MAG: type I methionyl aminopeptidase [Bacteroidetes bacterium GWE2_32_14]OFY08894.1 MAG: type I methionyl aminopeptidase [Bacteroidetes bacterium GWF2_33_16]